MKLLTFSKISFNFPSTLSLYSFLWISLDSSHIFDGCSVFGDEEFSWLLLVKNGSRLNWTPEHHDEQVEKFKYLISKRTCRSIKCRLTISCHSHRFTLVEPTKFTGKTSLFVESTCVSTFPTHVFLFHYHWSSTIINICSHMSFQQIINKTWRMKHKHDKIIFRNVLHDPPHYIPNIFLLHIDLKLEIVYIVLLIFLPTVTESASSFICSRIK